MKWKKLILMSIMALLIVFAGCGVYFLWNARLSPFSTGTRDKAFLGTTFGMSPQEVRRAVAKHGAQLLSYEDYRKTEPEPSIETFDFIPMFSDDRREDTSSYMSSIEMFDSKVEAEFHFRRERLTSVGVHIDPIAHGKADSVVAAVESKLRSTYQFLSREDSHDVRGGYTLHFASASASPSLWVNLTQRDRPVIVLTIVHPAARMSRTREVVDREHTAFGGKK